jgi:CTP:molybdopterin cytidylyltransferase MocA
MGNETVFVLLAGGKSERMGVDKGLLKFKHTFWILEQLNRISKTKIKMVYIGLGFNYLNYFKAIPWFKTALTNEVDYHGLKIKTMINPTPELGSFSTLHTVLNQLNTTSDILINPIDVPLLNLTELNKIIMAKNSVVIPNFEGKRGHPIKIDAEYWQYLRTLNITDEDARLDFQLKKINPVKISQVEVKDKFVIKNINTKATWLDFLNECD